MSTTRSLTRVAALGVAALALAAVPVAPASASVDLACGDTVFESTVLTHDLVCGPGDGLVIGADDVVLDLGGHTVSGPGAYGAGAAAGVRVQSRDGVIITNGTLTGWAEGVVLSQSTHAVVSKVWAHHNDRAVNVGTGGGHRIEKNRLEDNGRDAVRLAGSVGNVVAQNTVTGNVYGIGVADGSAGNVVRQNVVTGNEQFGLAAYTFAVSTTFAQNTVSGTQVDGIQVTGDTSDTVLDRNKSSYNGDDGIDVASASTRLTKNTAIGNADLGIVAVTGVDDRGGNKASGNGDPRQCVGVVCSPAY